MMQDKYAHRRQKTVIRFTENGKPIADIRVRVRQQRHEFLFGCGAFETINRTPASSPKERNFYKTAVNEEQAAFYRQRMDLWLELFNYGTLPFYLGKFEPEEGHTIARDVMEAAKWLKSHDVTLKGHPLCWHTACADWLMNYSNEDIVKIQKARIARDMAEFKGLVDMWDVVNEAVIMPVFDKYDNAITRICQQLGRVNMVKTMFDEARKTNPGATLLINDFNTSPKYEQLIERCLDAGVPIDAIGIQSHQHQGYWGKEKLLDVLERFARFGLPLHFTENTFISGALMPPEIVDLNDWQVDVWPSTQEGLQRQSENFEEFYRILFADPHVEAITIWSFHDNAWLHAPAGLVTEQNEKKPAFHTLHHLIKEEWWTDTELVTDSNGCAVLEGYRGSYCAEVGQKIMKFDLSRQAEITLEIGR